MDHFGIIEKDNLNRRAQFLKVKNLFRIWGPVAAVMACTALPASAAPYTFQSQITKTPDDYTYLSAYISTYRDDALGVGAFADVSRQHTLASGYVYCPSSDPYNCAVSGGGVVVASGSIKGIILPEFTNEFLDWSSASGVTSIPMSADLIAVARASDGGAFIRADSSAGVSYKGTTGYVGASIEYLSPGSNAGWFFDAPAPRSQSITQQDVFRFDYDLTQYQLRREIELRNDEFFPVPPIAAALEGIWYSKGASINVGGGLGISSAYAYADPIVTIDTDWLHIDRAADVSFTYAGGSVVAPFSLRDSSGIAPVPVPPGLALMLGGLGMIVAVRRKKRA